MQSLSDRSQSADRSTCAANTSDSRHRRGALSIDGPALRVAAASLCVIKSDMQEDDYALTSDEVDDLIEPTEAQPVRYSGQDFDVDGLIRRFNNNDIKIPRFGITDADVETAGFQRGFVWTRRQMDRFIESILLGYPIPGIFLVKQQDRRLLVLDGQQRIQTLVAFHKGHHAGRAFSLENVSKQFLGLMYHTLEPEQRRTFENTFIQATIVDADASSGSMDAIYQIFERLNSGGTQLTPHQIRVALFSGPLIDKLEELNSDRQWRDLYGRKNQRIRDQELILRALALYLDQADYAKPLKQFLNTFAKKHRDATDSELGSAIAQFNKAVRLLSAGPGPESLRRQSKIVNAAQAESVLVALMRVSQERELAPAAVTEAVDKLKADVEFNALLNRNTSDEDSILKRVHRAEQLFRNA